MSNLREELADLEHQQWSRTINHIFNQTKVTNDGIMLSIPIEIIESFLEKSNTPYAQLSETQKGYDRAWADDVLMIISNHMRAQAS